MKKTCEGRRERGVWYSRVFVGVAALAAVSMVQAEIVYGPPVTLNEGTARVYLLVDEGTPLELGVAIDTAFMGELPADGSHGGVVMPDGRSTFEYLLEMPPENPTPFQHVTLDWNPRGHEPDGVYDVAHLDVHFYLIGLDERLAIDPRDPGFAARASRLPEPAYIPAGYVDPGLPAVPMMGVHLVDPASPELRAEDPAPFEYTFIYGAWDGRITFLEPMVATAFLESRQGLEMAIPVAERHAVPGYYPQAYRIAWEDARGEHRIALTNWVRRGGGEDLAGSLSR